MRARLRTWSDDELVAAVARHTNLTDVLRELGLRPAGGNHASVRRHVARLALDTSHFTNDRRLRGLRALRERQALPMSQLFCTGSRVGRQTLRKYTRRRLAPYRCEGCGNEGSWNGAPLTLQGDHRNGTYDDDRLEDLRWLCPNCHSQTDDFAGRGTTRRVRELPAAYHFRPTVRSRGRALRGATIPPRHPLPLN